MSGIKGKSTILKLLLLVTSLQLLSSLVKANISPIGRIPPRENCTALGDISTTDDSGREYCQCMYPLIFLAH